MKKELLILFSIYTIAIPLFWFGNYMTPTPGSSSGNGNPALISMLILFILFLMMIYYSIKIINHHYINRLISLIGIVLTSLHLTIAFFHQRNSFQNYKEVIAQAYENNFGFVDWNYIDQITTWFSIHVNNQFFNLNTYFMFISSAILMSLVLSLIPPIRRSKIFN